MNAPVDENAAAGNFLGGEGTAETGDGTVCTEAYVYVIDLAQLAGLNDLAEAVNSGVEAVNHTDVQNLAGLMLSLLHSQSLGINTSCGLLAKNVLACLEGVDGDEGVLLVGGADGNCLDLGIVENYVIILNSGAATVLLYALLSLVKQDVAEILDLYLLVLHIRGDVSTVGDRTATDDRNLHFCHSG